MNKEVFWLWNDFGYYHPVPLAGKRAYKFLEERNQEQGGTWELHTPEQYNEWWEKKGKHLEFLKKL